MNIIFSVPGEPRGKGRAKWSKFGTYSDRKTVNYETLIQERFNNKYPNFTPLNQALILTLTAFLLIPASKSKKKQLAMESEEIRPTKRPDYDNILKIVSDALEKLAYVNDAQIVDAVFHKYYSYTPHLLIEISTVGQD